MLRIWPEHVDVSLVSPADVSDPELLRRYRELLSPGERTRLDRFRFAVHRHRYLVAHALVRTVLARATGMAPEALRFVCSARGRPELVQPAGHPRVRFSLSHTEDLVVCAVLRAHDVGVDVENACRALDTSALAERFFAPAERDELRALAGRDLDERFLAYWTLKEAYGKARGLGLADTLAAVSFARTPAQGLRVWFDARLDDSVADWQFLLLQPTPFHRAAVAVRRRAEADLRLRVTRTVPLVGEEPIGCRVLALTTEPWCRATRRHGSPARDNEGLHHDAAL